MATKGHTSLFPWDQNKESKYSTYIVCMSMQQHTGCFFGWFSIRPSTLSLYFCGEDNQIWFLAWGVLYKNSPNSKFMIQLYSSLHTFTYRKLRVVLCIQVAVSRIQICCDVDTVHKMPVPLSVSNTVYNVYALYAPHTWCVYICMITVL